MMPFETVGQTRKFDCQPYHRGTMKITNVEVASEEKLRDGKIYRRWKVTGSVIEGTTTSRLGAHSSNRPMEPGQPINLWVTGAELVDPDRTLVYVYPV